MVLKRRRIKGTETVSSDAPAPAPGTSSLTPAVFGVRVCLRASTNGSFFLATFEAELTEATATIGDAKRRQEALDSTFHMRRQEMQLSVATLEARNSRLVGLIDALDPVRDCIGWLVAHYHADGIFFISKVEDALDRVELSLRHDADAALVDQLAPLRTTLASLLANKSMVCKIIKRIEGLPELSAIPGFDFYDNVDKACSVVYNRLTDTRRQAAELEEEHARAVRDIDATITQATTKRNAAIQQAMAMAPSLPALLPILNVERLEATPGRDCPICMVRLGWPNDRVFLGDAHDIHFAVQLKCCRQFVGESCARILLSAEDAKCPFCRTAPLALDGGLNDITM